MECLPEEILLHLFSFLDPLDVAFVQLVSRRLHSIGQDNKLWKSTCFHNSQQEARRRRDQAISDQEARLAALRNAINDSVSPASLLNTNSGRGGNSETRRRTAFANWDPSYPGEQVNFYEEYIHRHAPVSLRYFQPPKDDAGISQQDRECLGVGAIADGSGGEVLKLLSPLDDGSVCIWDASFRSQGRGRIIVRSPPGVLQGDASRSNVPLQQLTAETGAVDNVSVDSSQQKAFVANESHLHELDLNTLQVIRRQAFPFPITALSEAKNPTPLTVGTNMTLHLYDPRVSRPQLGVGLSSRCELIAGSPMLKEVPATDVSSAHAPLSQPGPLSILHLPGASTPEIPSHSIWVAGRFTSLLHYDRRFWPRIEGTLFSGARLSSMSALPYPFVHPQFRSPSAHPNGIRSAKHVPGVTIIAAGEYKGKGSLELYGLPLGDVPEHDHSTAVAASPRFNHLHQTPQFYHNRQYASKSRLLSVAPHGARIVFSDGDGTLKWVERDAWSVVRSFNINEPVAYPDDNTLFSQTTSSSNSSTGTLFAAQPSDDPNSDIVQKILPLPPCVSGEANTNDLVIWTGDGRLGLVGFGRKSLQPFGAHGATADATRSLDGHGDVDDSRAREQEDERERERVYAGRMREALERQADETRWVRGLGLGF